MIEVNTVTWVPSISVEDATALEKSNFWKFALYRQLQVHEKVVCTVRIHSFSKQELFKKKRKCMLKRATLASEGQHMSNA